MLEVRRLWRDVPHLVNLHADVVRERQGVPLREIVKPGCADMAEVCRDVQVAVALGQRRHATLGI